MGIAKQYSYKKKCFRCKIECIEQEINMDEKILVTRPSMPSYEEYIEAIEKCVLKKGNTYAV